MQTTRPGCRKKKTETELAWREKGKTTEAAGADHGTVAYFTMQTTHHNQRSESGQAQAQGSRTVQQSVECLPLHVHLGEGSRACV